MSFRGIVAGLVAVVLACGSVTLEAQRSRNPRDDEKAPKYSGNEVGPTPVGSIPDVRLRDNDRNKDIELTIDYPTRGTAHPLIVLSPGFGASHRGYVGLSSYWAGNNYVVIRVNHADRTSGVTSAEDIWANATPSDWKNRVRDLSYVLDSVPALVKMFPELENKIDMNKIAVAGHGYGAHTAMLIGGARTFPGGVSYADPRVKALLLLSPAGPSDQRGLTKESWTELKIPTLFLTGSLDRGMTDAETPEWRGEGFRLAPAGDKWLVTLEGASQLTFAGGLQAGMLEQIAREKEGTSGPNIPMAPDPRDPGTIGRPPSGREVMGGTNDRPRSSRTENMAMQQRNLFAMSRGIALTFFDTYLNGDAAARAELEKIAERKVAKVEKK